MQNYLKFCKKLHLRCLTGFLIRLCWVWFKEIVWHPYQIHYLFWGCSKWRYASSVIFPFHFLLNMVPTIWCHVPHIINEQWIPFKKKVQHLWWSFLAKIVNDYKLITIFKKNSIIDFRQGPKYAFRRKKISNSVWASQKNVIGILGKES